MIPTKPTDITGRLNELRGQYAKRDALIRLCRQTYDMRYRRDTSFLGVNAIAWREKTPDLYWQSSSRAHNTVDIATAILTGHPPQFRVTIPGGGDNELTSRAEKFLLGVIRSNSRRLWGDLTRRVCFRMVLDGGVGVRVTWDVNAPEPTMKEMPFPDGSSHWVALYPRNMCPIALDVVKIDKLYPSGGPAFGTPYTELYHVEQRSVGDVIREWRNVPEAQKLVSLLRAVPETDHERKKGDYIQWWGYDEDGTVMYGVVFEGMYVLEPRAIGYPRIPYVIGSYKECDTDDPTFERLPLIYPILWAVEREEYVRSRVFRMVDLFTDMVPVYRGTSPRNADVSGAWGKVIQLTDERESFEFPRYPSAPPDVWALLADIQRIESEGTFSGAMFGEVSSRLSGYGLAQLIGADTLRMDTPRSNLKLLWSVVADTIFDLLEAFSPDCHVAVTSQVKGTILSAMLSGAETPQLVVDTFIKPKQSSDEMRMATLGAQLANLPQRLVSNRYILENFFGIAQPEDEIQEVMAEEAQRDPVIKLMAILNALVEQDSPFAPIIAMQLEKVLGSILGGQGKLPVQTAPQPIEGMGMGMPQAIEGQPPEVQPGGTVTEEANVGTPEVNMWGGPTPEEM